MIVIVHCLVEANSVTVNEVNIRSPKVARDILDEGQWMAWLEIHLTIIR